MRDSRREKGGSKWAKRSLTRFAGVGALPSVSRRSAVGHLRARGTAQRPSVAVFRVLGTPLRWSLLFAFSAPAFVGSRSSQVRTQTRTEPRGAQKLSTGAAKGRTGAMHNGGWLWPRIGLNALAIVRGGDCTEASQDCRPRGASVFVDHR